jgi:hypothetical protein
MEKEVEPNEDNRQRIEPEVKLSYVSMRATNLEGWAWA